MDAFDFDNNLMKVKKLFRIIEIFVALIFLSWAATRLPFAVTIAGEYSRRIITVVFSHLFIFLLSNVIVLTLFFNFRNLFPQQNLQNLSEDQLDFCQEFIHNSDGGGAGAHFGAESSGEVEEIVYEDKQTILEVTRVKVHRRSQSAESFRRDDESLAEDCKKLRRSETEMRRRVEVEVVEAAAENGEMVDDLSNEEFQRTIEAFITKQMKFHQEEKLAIVLHGCT